MKQTLEERLKDLDKWIAGYEKDKARADKNLKEFKKVRAKIIRQISNLKWGIK